MTTDEKNMTAGGGGSQDNRPESNGMPTTGRLTRKGIAAKVAAAAAAATVSAGCWGLGYAAGSASTSTAPEPTDGKPAETESDSDIRDKWAVPEPGVTAEEASEEAVEPENGGDNGSTAAVTEPSRPTPEPEPEPASAKQDGPAHYDLGYAPYSENPEASRGVTDWNGYGFYLAHSDTSYGQMSAAMQPGDKVAVNGETVTIQGKTTAEIGSDTFILFDEYGWDASYFGTCIGDDRNIWVAYGR